jgi:Sulfotransferase family
MKAFLWGRPADACYARELKELPRQLVFIMGCHRSGTSMLYHLLAYTGACAYISAYDIVKYDEIVRNRVEGREESVKSQLDTVLRLEKNRGVDNLPVGADYPEEYRFLLAPRASRWFLSVRKRVEQMSFAPHLTCETRPRFLEICRKKRFLAGADRPLILKNPNDFYFNFEAIHRMFPEAKMIFIHRHPLSILNSYVAGFGGIMESRSAYAALMDPRYGDLFRFPIWRGVLRRAFRGEQLPRFMTAGLVRSYRYYLEKIRLMPDDRFLALRYEDLCQDPERHLSRIGQWLNLGAGPRIPENFVAPRSLRVADRVRAAYVQRVEEMRPYLESQNYRLLPD